MATWILSGNLIASHLECPVCACKFRNPKVLHCLHSFCLQCLKELAQCQDPKSTKLKCPLCRYETKLPSSGVAGLHSNFTISALLEEVTIQEKLLKSQESGIRCQSCDEHAQAVSVCMDCELFICTACQCAHKHIKTTQSHMICEFTQLPSQEARCRSKVRDEIPLCKKHPLENLSIYCNTCEQLICTCCIFPSHKKHSLMNPQEAGKRCKIKLAKLAAEAKNCESKLSRMLSENNKVYIKLYTTFTDSKMKISEKADKVVAKIRAEEQKLLKEAESIYKKRISRYKAVQSFNSKKQMEVKQKLEEVNGVFQMNYREILEDQHNLVSNLTELMEVQPETVSESQFFMEFVGSEGLLGKLVANKQSPLVQRFCTQVGCKLNTKIKTMTTSFIENVQEVAALSNNDVVATTRDGKLLLSSSQPICEPSLPQTVQELYIAGLKKVKSISVNKDNQLILLDEQTVKVLNKQFKLLYQFTPKLAQCTKPTCLAVDSNNLIAVGYMSSKEISLHNPDGSLIRRVHTPMIDHYLTTYKQQLIYTSLMEHKLISTRYDGTMVFSVDIAKDRNETTYPNGVCCDSNGNIFVAVWPMHLIDGKDINGHILQYSPDGQYIACVIKGCPIPRGITVTPQGDLVIAGWGSISIYHKEFSQKQSEQALNCTAHSFVF